MLSAPSGPYLALLEKEESIYGSAIVDPMPGLPPTESVAQDIEAPGVLADKRMTISKTKYASLSQMREDVAKMSRRLDDPSLQSKDSSSFLVESLRRYREALGLQSYLESQFGGAAQMSATIGGDTTIDAFSGEEVRGLFNKLRDAMKVLSEKVGDETGKSLASRISVLEERNA